MTTTKKKLASKFDNNKIKTNVATSGESNTQVTKQKTKKHLPLEVNLEEIMNPNPAIKAAYNSVPGANEYFYWTDKADWNNERRIFA